MATTMQQVVDGSRVPLNDDGKDRWDDPTLFGYAVMALRRLRRERPDLFMPLATVTNLGALTLGSNFPLTEDLLEPVYDYIRARAESHDTEPVDATKAPVFFQLFKGIEG